MPKVLIIGETLCTKNYDLLSRYGDITSFSSLKALHLKHDDPIALLIIEKGQVNDRSFRGFIKKYKAVPKIVVSYDRAGRGFGPWLRLPLTFPVFNPTDRDLLLLGERLMAEQTLQSEHERLKDVLSTSKKELEFFGAIGNILTSDREFDDMLSAIMKKTKEMMQASSWSIYLLDEETGELVLEKTNARSKKEKGIKPRLKQGEGIAGWVVQEGIPLVVPDVSRDERFISAASPENIPKAKSLICVPIKSRGQAVGALEISNKKTDGPFTKADLDILIHVIDYTALAVEKVTLYHKMAELAITDDLTKLFNSRYLNRTIEVELNRSERSQTSVSLIFMDIDYFKQVNDHFGHLVGSKLLVEVGQLLLRNLRSIDIIARYGGDEFVVVLPQTPPDIAAKVAERVRRSIEQTTFLKKDGRAIHITASFGVASYPESAKTKEELIKLADEAMYRVKYNTRNGVYAII